MASDAARAVRGRLDGTDVTLTSVTSDSRTAGPGALFVALPGEHRDGHAFVQDAFARGAAAALVHREVEAGGSLIRVTDTGQALLDLAADERRASSFTVVAVTGANGKTTTKDMTAAVCGKRSVTHASPASFNNEIGLPLTLLGASPQTEVVVAEMGARRVGDVELLCQIARPDIAVVTNVGVAHMEVFGSWDAIVRASAEPVQALGDQGTAVLNADDPVVSGYAARTQASVVTFGIGEADVRAASLEVGADGYAAFDLCWGGGRERVKLAVPGEHMVSNALAAAAVGVTLGVPLEACADALEQARPSRWRMETFETGGGVLVVNDAYNANPESVAAALKTARWIAGRGRLVAVLGQMAELGPISHDEHERVGELAARLRVDRLITVGPEAKAIAVAAVREGVPPDDVASYDGVEEALADVRASVRSGDVVLCKASRVAGLEALAEALR